MFRRKGYIHKLHNHSDEDLKKTGIYTITSKINKKIYVGSAGVTKGTSDAHLGFNNRWRDHIYHLLHNTHVNRHLQNHVNKYGIEDLEFEILEECDPITIAGRELYWINILNTILTGFNQCYPTNISYGINNPKYISLNEDMIIKLYIENKFTITEIARKFNISPTPIKRVLYGHNIKIYKNTSRLDFKKIHEEYMDSYMSIDQIAKTYSVPGSTLRRGFRKLNLLNKIEKIEKDIDKIYQRYLNGESIKEYIAKEYKSHFTTIHRVLDKHGYKKYNKNEYKREKYQFCFSS